ncbi:hypothetical protein L873DRAFT_1794841 [Choiromyces venosus 120613-1]|uniref:Major facilitator superfamily (MFS) profile domain-containing protein n=1 Tax=Choiromyces venosus 120613-1 TaxID=1336337 RepID=A0A3N4J4Z5_9PEZI|nr:hypothetical protein L873DRAFT_1794841 [Choiromyces venosus 120613-1]
MDVVELNLRPAKTKIIYKIPLALIMPVGTRYKHLTPYLPVTIRSAQYALHGSKAAGKAVVALIFLYNTTYNFGWSGLLVAYSVEILPYYIRARGFMLMDLAVQVALVFNQYVNPIGLKNLGWKYYIFYCSGSQLN